MCPLLFSRCPNHDIRFDCRNVRIFEENQRGYVICYLLCFNLKQITIFYKFHNDPVLRHFRTPAHDQIAFTAFRDLLKTPFPKLFIVTPRNIRTIPKHKE